MKEVDSLQHETIKKRQEEEARSQLSRTHQDHLKRLRSEEANRVICALIKSMFPLFIFLVISFLYFYLPFLPQLINAIDQEKANISIHRDDHGNIIGIDASLAVIVLIAIFLYKKGIIASLLERFGKKEDNR